MHRTTRTISLFLALFLGACVSINQPPTPAVAPSANYSVDPVTIKPQLIETAWPGIPGMHRGGASAIECPFDVYGLPDGCDAAAAGLIIHPTFFTAYANEGHTFAAARPNHNLAGVEYGVGQITATGSMADPSATPPATCTWDGTDDWTNCAGSGTDILDIHGYYFNGKRLYIHGSYCGTVKIHDNYFLNTAASSTSSGDLIRIDDSGTGACGINLQVYNNTIDAQGNNAALPVLSSIISDNRSSTSGSAASKYWYNAVLHTMSKFVIKQSCLDDINMNYNYFEEFDFPPGNGAHGEFSLQCGTGGTVTSYTSNFNTVYLPSTTVTQGHPNLGGPTTMNYASNGTSTQTYTTTNIEYNTYVAQAGTNTIETGLTAGLIDLGEISYGTVNLLGNWIYPAGALYCMIIGHGLGDITTLNQSGNVDAYDNSTLNLSATGTPCPGHTN